MTPYLSGDGSDDPVGLEVKTYADSIRFKTCTHIAFGPEDLEIISDLKNNRFLYRARFDDLVCLQ